MRRKFVIGNWKMNKSLSEGVMLAKEVKMLLQDQPLKCEVVLATPFIHLATVAEVLGCGNVQLGAQNCSDKESGAFTGEVSVSMIKSTGANYVIIGHSERRQYFLETSEILKEKITLALKNELTPVLCVGEKLDEREAGIHFSVVATQLKEALSGFSPNDFSKVIIAYEPVWAIGTGKTATVEQAQEMHKNIRKAIALKFNADIADKTTILYGGSCNPTNAKDLFAAPDIDGGLIGGASLNAQDFACIVESI